MTDDAQSDRHGFRMGLAMWAFREWLGDLYPKGSASSRFLALYSERFTTVEGNTTFYAVPTAETVQRWTEETPEHFHFCPKIPREFTHDGPLMPSIQGALAFAERMSRLGSRLGPMLLQLPPSYGIEQIMDLGYFLRDWPRERVPLTVEVRHRSWFTAEGSARLDRMLTRAGVGRAILDTRPVYEGPGDPQANGRFRKPRVPVEPTVTAPITMVRFISHPELEVNLPYLRQWASFVERQLAAGVTVYFFVHCPEEQRSPGIAKRFQALLEEDEIPAPPLPWNELPEPSQATLF